MLSFDSLVFNLSFGSVSFSVVLPAGLCVDLNRASEFRHACVFVYLQLRLVDSELLQPPSDRELAREIVVLASSVCDLVSDRMTGGAVTPELVVKYVREGTLIHPSRSVKSTLIRLSSITNQEVSSFPA